ncbi:MAG: hypothetical protein JWO86_1616 [Myxococcaceae bacterium]|nr:hypothetical protein [Myxococcaceae bacterium]
MATTPSDEAPPTDAAKVAAICAAVLGLVLAVAALAVLGMRAGVSVAIGAAIAVANLVMMSAIVRAVLRPAEAEAEAMADANVKANAEAKADADADASASTNEDEEADAVDHVAEGKRGAAAWGAFGLLKILVLFGGIYVLLTKGLVDPMPLVVGYGVLPLGIAASSLFSGLAPRSRRAARPRPRTK